VLVVGRPFAPASGPAADGGHAAVDGHGCRPTTCTLERPREEELRAIVADADRMLATYGGDTTVLARQCVAVAATMKSHSDDVRMLPFMWRAQTPTGELAPVTGDAHTVVADTAAGTVHIARGFDALNPDRGLPAIIETARHEFAHLTGSRQSDGGFDVAAQLARACGPGADTSP
jgi:hypothetical protein